MKITLDNYQLSEYEKLTIKELLAGSDGECSLERLWALIDQVWLASGCGEFPIQQACLDAFYRHPVWALNGLFIEQDLDSMAHRRAFAALLAGLGPSRVVDVGGGFGTLARLVSGLCPMTRVDILEPYPTLCMKNLVETYPQIEFVNELNFSDYDVLVCTDVLEHVQDPLMLLVRMVASVRIGGHLLIANCFEPSVLCHLPSTFHLRFSFDNFCVRLGLERLTGVSLPYGGLYKKNYSATLSLERMRYLEKVSRRLYPLRCFVDRFHVRHKISAVKQAVLEYWP